MALLLNGKMLIKEKERGLGKKWDGAEGLREIAEGLLAQPRIAVRNLHYFK